MATSYSQWSLADLEKEKNRIEKAIERKSGQQRTKVLTRIASIAKQSGFELGDLLGDKPAASGRAKKKASGRTSKAKGRKVAPKYRHPSDKSITWTGRGRTPLWVVDLEKKGKSREEFLIKK